MSDKIFAGGMRFERPAPNAPEWIKGKLSIKADETIDFIQKYKNEKGWLNIDLKKSKDGNLYLELNTFKSDKQKVAEGEIISSEIPF